MTDTKTDRPDVVALPPVFFVLALLLGIGLEYLIPGEPLPRAVALAVGSVLCVLSVALGAWAMRTFARGRTHLDVRKPTIAIVTDGPFRFSRNPIYLAFVLLLLGIAGLANSTGLLLAALPLVATLRWGVIDREEIYLEEKFGEEYRHFKRSVRRWI